jgi:hypothetical protein
MLGEYQLDMLSGEQTASIQDHLKICVLCATEIATLAHFLVNDPLLVAHATATLPVATNSQNSHSVRDAQDIIGQWSSEGMAAVRYIVATLLSPQPRLAYQRDVADATSQWPRRYSAEDLTISIQVERTPQHAHQRGALQLLGLVTCAGKALEELQGVSVLLVSQTKAGTEHDQASRAQVIDDLGNFIFSSVESDTYALQLQLPERVVIIDQLALTV